MEFSFMQIYITVEVGGVQRELSLKESAERVIFGSVVKNPVRLDLLVVLSCVARK